MLATKSICFYLFLISVAVPQVFSSTRANKTASDGKVFITGDHNEVVVSTARETKMELAEIKSKLQLLGKRDEKFSEKIESLERTVESLDKNLEGKLNASNAALSMQVQAMSKRITTLDTQGM